MLKIYLLILGFLLLYGIIAVNGKKIMCYRCSECPDPFEKDKATELGNCNYCRTVYTYRGPENKKIEKDCVNSCIAQDRRRNDAGIVTECCTENLCNSQSRLYSKSTVVSLMFSSFVLTLGKYIIY